MFNLCSQVWKGTQKSWLLAYKFFVHHSRILHIYHHIDIHWTFVAIFRNLWYLGQRFEFIWLLHDFVNLQYVCYIDSVGYIAATNSIIATALDLRTSKSGCIQDLSLLSLPLQVVSPYETISSSSSFSTCSRFGWVAHLASTFKI